MEIFLIDTKYAGIENTCVKSVNAKNTFFT